MKLLRAEGILDLQVVRKFKIAFLGLGSLGSRTAAILAYPFREIVLCDPDTLGEENRERHLLVDESFLGRPKAEGVAKWLVDERGLGPETKLTVHVGRAQEILDQHPDVNLAIVSIDSQKAKFDINAFHLERAIPAIYGGVYSKGVGGNVVYIPTPQDQCYSCSQLLIGVPFEGKVDVNYGIDPTTLVDDTGDLKAVPALLEAIDAISADMADFATDFIQGSGRVAQIQIRAIDDWVPIVNLANDSDGLAAVAGLVARQTAIGLVPNMRLRRVQGRYQLQIAHGTQALALKRQSQCQYHADQSSLSLSQL